MKKLVAVLAIAFVGGLSGCVTIAEHDLFVDAADKFAASAAAVSSRVVWASPEARASWLSTEADFEAARKAARK